MKHNIPEAITFRNQLDALLVKFLADYRRRDAVACAKAYTQDAVLHLPKAAPIRGRVDIAAALLAGMDAGLDLRRLITMHSESDDRIGYAVQVVHSNKGEGISMIALRCEDDGIWRICSELAVDE